MHQPVLCCVTPTILILTDIETCTWWIIPIIESKDSHLVSFYSLERSLEICLFNYSIGSSSAVTVAGVTGSASGARSLLNYPTAISVTANGTMFIMDTSNYRIMRWDAGDPLGVIVAGGQGNGAAFNQIGVSYELFVDSQYNVYVSENSNHRITLWTILNMTSGVLVSNRLINSSLVHSQL